MKKKLAAAALCIVMAGALTACGKELSNENLTIKQYKGLEVKQVEDTGEVTDAYVENTMNSYRGASLDTEGTAKDGDTVRLDYVGKVDDVAFEGGTAQGAELELGSGAYIGANGDYKGFEEQIVGHDVGETFDIEVKFPSNYQNAEMADKVAVFTVTIKGIYPDITDEWVTGVSEKSKTVEEFKKEIRENIENYNKERVQSQLRSEVMDALLSNVDVKELPSDEIDEEISQMNEYYESMAEQYDVEFAEFLTTYMGMDEEAYNEQAKKTAEQAVTRKIACDLIADKHKLVPSDKELEEEIKELAEQAGIEDIDEFKKVYGEDVIYNSILQRRVADYLVESCVQVEKDDTADSEE